MLHMHGLPAVALTLLLFACGDDTTATGGAPTGGNNTGGETPTAGAPPTGGTGGEAPTCFENEVPLLVDTQRLYVPVEVDGAPGLFFIDTGSALTFLNLGPDGPAFVEDAATLTIGCETLSIPARGGLQLLPDAFGQPVLGYLGADYFIESTSLLDVPGERVVRPINQPIAAEASLWPAIAYDDVQGHIIAPVLLDATPVRLMLDTGAFHTLWLGQEGEPGDQEIETADAEGNPLFFFLGEVDLEMAGRDVVSVPVLRAPSFPYFEQTVASLGGNIHGLLGLTSFRERAMMFDGTAHEVRLGPVP
jgi:hypothetical protein